MYFTVCFAVNEHQMTTYFSTYPFQRRNFQFNEIKTDKKEKSLNTEIAIILQWVQNLVGESRIWSMLHAQRMTGHLVRAIAANISQTVISVQLIWQVWTWWRRPSQSRYFKNSQISSLMLVFYEVSMLLS